MSQDLLISFLGDEDSETQGTDGHPTESIGSGDIYKSQHGPSTPSGHKVNLEQADSQVEDDDEFGDFENASVPGRTGGGQGIVPENPLTATPLATKKVSSVFPPKVHSKAASPGPPSDAQTKDVKIGQHPFAGHMDFLFDTGDDEYDAGADELGDLATNPEAAMAFSKRIIAEQEAAPSRETKLDLPKKDNKLSNANLQAEPNKLRKKSGYVPPKDPNVLFDADNVSEDDDEFGGFEAGNQSSVGDPEMFSECATAEIPANMPAIDLLGIDDNSSPARSNVVNGNVSATQQAAQVPRNEVRHQSVTPATTAKTEEDSWEDFETAASGDLTDTVPQSSSPPMSYPRPLNTSAKGSTEEIPSPTNVPPPAILISLFPSILAQADEALFDIMGRLDLKQRQMLLSHPASHQFLKGYLGHCTVMAHIIAGRKLRWKRDQHLSQSMRIGPATASGKGGMKLAGLDKSEVAKEDREVADVLQLWKSQVGKLRTAVTAASSMHAAIKLPSVPELADQMAIKTVKLSEGGLIAPHACALCGLKREERVAKVDIEVDDSFGEWWAQSINMHAGCRAFWEEFEKKLKSR